MYCTKCGAQIDDHADFCVKCGAPTRKNQLKTKLLKYKKYFIAVAACLILLVGLGIYLSSNHQTKVEETKVVLTTEEQYIIGRWKGSLYVIGNNSAYSSEYTLKIYEDHTGEIVYTNNENKKYCQFTWSFEEDKTTSELESYEYDVQLDGGSSDTIKLMYIPAQGSSSESLSYISKGSSYSILSFENKSNTVI